MKIQNMLFPKGSSKGVPGTFGAGRINMVLGRVNMVSSRVNMVSGRVNMVSGRVNMLFPGNPLDREEQKCSWEE